MESTQSPGWYFIDDQGTFELKNLQENSYLYFPLINQAGMMSSITPTLNGDAKLDQNTFLLLPVSVEDLHNTRSARNFWVRINGTPWSVSGNSAAQISQRTSEEDEDVTLQAGFLWHSLTRRHAATGLSACVTNFVPANDDTLELMQVTLENQGDEPLELEPIAAIPIYGRSADNLRDHRHVTALLHRTQCHKYGVLVTPTMSFDERGHKENHITYAVLGLDGDGNPPEGFTPLVEDFIGEGGCLTWPKAVLQGDPPLKPAQSRFEGFESIGGLHFPHVTLAPGDTKRYILLLSILKEGVDLQGLIKKYGSTEKFSNHLETTRHFWQDKFGTLKFDHQDERLDGWLGWVELQPILRRIMGNSFLPYHDYGRGGRGWRDLWQDLLALLLTEQTPIEKLLLSNFAGVRMDGSNATIVGSQPGEFKADRNSIPRVWMDHGAWPLLTTKLYLDWTGDLTFLLERQRYFRDHLSHRGQKVDPQWKPEQETVLKSQTGDLIQGSVFEHLLVQHLTVFFNVGEHNIIKLEGGDWNDGLDMAAERGESVAFSAMYAGNLRTLSDLCHALIHSGVEQTDIAVELLPLLDRLDTPVDYNTITAKQALLQSYFDSVAGELSGECVSLPLEKIRADLEEKADWLAKRIQQHEWVTDEGGRGWFNGYYDNNGRRVEGAFPQGVRMTLTGQVFPLLAGIGSQEQVEQVIQTANAYLYDPSLRGYRLNTNFGENPPELGRAFAFAYGHKENGALFSHMAVMFAYALYQRGMAQAGWQVLNGLYTQSQEFSTSRIYPGIPEYFNPRGRGMYPYLTGSAAWYILTLLTESFGVKGVLGDLYLEPKLVAEQFAQADQLSLQTTFAGKRLDIIYINPKRLTYGAYVIGTVSVNGTPWETSHGGASTRFPRAQVKAWTEPLQIVIVLTESAKS